MPTMHTRVTRIALASTLLIGAVGTLLSAASCARAIALPPADGVPHQRVLTIGHGVALRAGPTLTALPPAQRYRFVSPDSLVSGLDAEVMAEREAELRLRRQAFSADVGHARWVEATDSVQFDVAIFTTRATTLHRGNDAPAPIMPETECGAPSTQLQQCSQFPSAAAWRWDTRYETYHVLRRRSDGAVRVWRHGGTRAASDRTSVGADLRELFRASERPQAPEGSP